MQDTCVKEPLAFENCKKNADKPWPGQINFNILSFLLSLFSQSLVVSGRSSDVKPLPSHYTKPGKR